MGLRHCNLRYKCKIGQLIFLENRLETFQKMAIQVVITVLWLLLMINDIECLDLCSELAKRFEMQKVYQNHTSIEAARLWPLMQRPIAGF